MPSVHCCEYYGCAYCSASLYRVKWQLFKCGYCEHCIKVEKLVLGEGERNTLAQSHEWDSSREDGEVAGISDELEGREG